MSVRGRIWAGRGLGRNGDEQQYGKKNWTWFWMCRVCGMCLGRWCQVVGCMGGPRREVWAPGRMRAAERGIKRRNSEKFVELEFGGPCCTRRGVPPRADCLGEGQTQWQGERGHSALLASPCVWGLQRWLDFIFLLCYSSLTMASTESLRCWRRG